MLVRKLFFKLYKYIVESATIEDFAGNGEENSMDGPAVAQCSFRQLCGIDVEFDNVVYTQRTQCQERLILHLLLPNTVKFLKAVGDLYKGFSVHNKGKACETFNL